MFRKLFGLLVVSFVCLLIPVIAYANPIAIEGHVTQSETVVQCPDELITELFGLRRDYSSLCPDELILLRRLQETSMRGEMVTTTVFHFYAPAHSTCEVDENFIRPRGHFSVITVTARSIWDGVSWHIQNTGVFTVRADSMISDLVAGNQIVDTAQIVNRIFTPGYISWMHLFDNTGTWWLSRIDAVIDGFWFPYRAFARL